MTGETTEMGKKAQCPGIAPRALTIAYKQFCRDISLPWQQYEKEPEKKIYIQRMQYEPGTCYPKNPRARRVTGHDSFLKVILCMGRLFMGADDAIYDWALETYGACQPEWFCEYKNLRMLDAKLHEHGRKILDTHVYYLPTGVSLAGTGKKQGERGRTVMFQNFPLCWYEQDELLALKEGNRFRSAICFSKTQPDALAVAALKPSETSCISDGRKPEHEENMVGMAGCSADCHMLWQIGINVDTEYQGQGLAVGLVELLKEEIIRRGKIPFYGTSESHTVSQTIAYKTGFAPAWTELFVGREES